VIVYSCFEKVLMTIVLLFWSIIFAGVFLWYP